MQDKEHASIDAALTVARGTIPFKIAVDGSIMTIQIEGGKKPIVFDQMAMTANGQPTTLSKEVQEQVRKSAEKLQPVLLKFFFSNAPNPKKVSVSSVSEKVNNETLNLQKAHIELSGSELTELLKLFLTSVLADEEGLKELLGQVYDVAVPIIKEQMKASQEQMKKDYPDLETDSPTGAMPNLVTAYLDNKTLAVEFAYTTIHEYLKKAVEDFDKTIADSLASSNDGAQADAMFSDQLTFKADYLIDQDQFVRKQQFELTILL
ncbi:hypothetical protein [Paenibacillus hexagrammi]|uniref:Uncharacterized protein n=1 Tax=Paenibacillus hexagrammi TaxID=2908839 RepID=A0ABY3SGQ7_9BACL|nr:hypothetical protein [Paenibacillus sp. YPD9-1]UJF32914.1 hypothetical protein L0M14_25610 [Paenibacillus sp. YPD9-1]